MTEYQELAEARLALLEHQAQQRIAPMDGDTRLIVIAWIGGHVYCRDKAELTRDEARDLLAAEIERQEVASEWKYAMAPGEDRR